METGETATAGGKAYDGLPGEHVTIDQLVAFNMRYWRRAAGMTQEELGERIGWSAANISAAERSAGTTRERRRFDAHTITAVAITLGVPIIALFLPPPDDGMEHRYLFHRGGLDTDHFSMTDLMRVVVPDTGYQTPVMDAYRKRFDAAVTYYTDPEFGAQVARFLRDATDDELRADRAARIRQRQAELQGVVAELADIASALEHPEAGRRARRDSNPQPSDP